MARKEQSRDSDKKNNKKSASASTTKAASPVAAAVAASTMRGGGKVSAKRGTFIGRCICAHEFQDERYGAGMRVFNMGSNTGHCTVCGASRGA